MSEEINISASWKNVLKQEFEKSYFIELIAFVQHAYKTTLIYPKMEDVFNAFNACSFEKVRVVIIGQDPYHGAGQAHGLCFSVEEGVTLPPSLKNIFKEIQADLGVVVPKSGNLQHWAEQGVLMLNATLTVQAHSPGSHQKKGWEQFTDAVIQKISDEKEHVVFILWGAYAQKKGKIIDANKHLILQSAHPSPFSAYNGFFGNKHFSKTNDYLKSIGKKEIEW
ncbi:uracil-DNA glycosylase [uncultured Cytophaga sp.]|uniref:uracil-DNA glycosylase n=1 Tax=uncultured Cytophaga sp. TaxID=160238 RepID=UPI00262B3907|nr:uracil-DNA glycosylase [uncultured Cytophaga sp.]